jgi:triacylglycerol esterase/lipase EstA (alpha/beta hydrolase family)
VHDGLQRRAFATKSCDGSCRYDPISPRQGDGGVHPCHRRTDRSCGGAGRTRPIRPGAAAARGSTCRCPALLQDRSPARAGAVLLVPGTTLTPSTNYSWNYERSLTAAGIAWCTIALPHAATGDISVAGEYVVYALRTMHSRAGRRVDILGFSQGGMVPRWALRFWPDTRAMVDDYVALDPSNHGTVLANGLCTPGCAPAIWQQRAGSTFLTALNTGPETFAGISYTVIYSHFDDVVVPNTSDSGSSALHTGRGQIENIAVQDICPLDASDHLAMGSYDNVGYALAMDAFTHHGTAQRGRIDPTVCTSPLQPGVNPATFPLDYAGYGQQVATTLLTAPRVNAEPALPPYARS